MFSQVMLVVAALGADAKPVFDYTFGANCPYCRKFGPTLKQLYSAAGIADAVDFYLHFAIRTAGDPTVDHDYECPDENIGCPNSKWAECAFNATETTVEQRVSFLTCWDESTADAQSKAKTCAAQAQLDWTTIEDCHGGSLVAQLQDADAEYFEQRFPTHAHSGIYYVPHIFVDGEEQSDISYDGLLAALCAGGATASACIGDVFV